MNIELSFKDNLVLAETANGQQLKTFNNWCNPYLPPIKSTNK